MGLDWVDKTRPRKIFLLRINMERIKTKFLNLQQMYKSE